MLCRENFVTDLLMLLRMGAVIARRHDSWLPRCDIYATLISYNYPSTTEMEVIWRKVQYEKKLQHKLSLV